MLGQDIDLEQPSFFPKGLQNSVAVVTSAGTAKSVQVEIPVHLRYIAPSGQSSHVDVLVNAPLVYLAQTDGAWRPIRVFPQAFQQADKTCSTVVTLAVPVGQLAHSTLVRWTTLGITVVGAFFLVHIMFNRPFKYYINN